MEAGRVDNSEQMEPKEASPDPRRGRLWLTLLVLGAVCLYAVYRSALFRLERVQISGTERLDQSDVLDVARLSPGLLRWDLPAKLVEERLLTEPWIGAARAAWRSTSLVVEVQEREPVGMLHYQGRYYLLLDAEGRILGQRMLDEGTRLPVVAGLTITRALRGQQLNHQGLMDALTVLGTMSPELREKVAEVQVKEGRSLRLYMVSGTTVEWGTLPAEADRRSAQVEEKLKGLLEYYEKISRKNLATCTIDLRVDAKLFGTGCE